MVKYTCIDSFCGAGGLGLGLQQAGFDIRLSFDIDNRCIKTIEAIQEYKNCKMDHDDCREQIKEILAKKRKLTKNLELYVGWKSFEYL